MADKNNKINTSITFSSPSEVAPFVYKLYKQNVPRKKAEKIIRSSTYDFDTYALDMDLILNKIMSDVYGGEAYKGDEKEISFSPRELSFINDYCETQLTPEIIEKAKGKEKIRNLLCAYLAISRYDDYESGWINYHTKKIFNISGFSKVPEKIKNEIVNSLVAAGIIQLKVIGKKNPILCYKLNWRDVQAPYAIQDNYSLFIAPDTTSKEFVTDIEKIFQKLLTKNN